MSNYDPLDNAATGEYVGTEPRIILAEVVPEPPSQTPYRRPGHRRVWLPVVLFLATCLSTFLVGALAHPPSFSLVHGFVYSLALMTILMCHEMGHFLQARRYGVYASLPYFIPMPISPIGTFGAVIAMQARMGHRRALFDIGITGPLAGLVPTLIFCVVGLCYSEYVVPKGNGIGFGTPLLFDFLTQRILGPWPAGQAVDLHPLAFAGWVGLLITALNLLPIGQLDGGHVLYALLRNRAQQVGSLLLLGAVVAVVFFGYWMWALMLFLLLLMGPVHPPTTDESEPLGAGRIILGWLTLAFIPIGFTPTPFLLPN